MKDSGLEKLVNEINKITEMGESQIAALISVSPIALYNLILRTKKYSRLVVLHTLVKSMHKDGIPGNQIINHLNSPISEYDVPEVSFLDVVMRAGNSFPKNVDV